MAGAAAALPAATVFPAAPYIGAGLGGMLGSGVREATRQEEDPTPMQMDLSPFVTAAIEAAGEQRSGLGLPTVPDLPTVPGLKNRFGPLGPAGQREWRRLGAERSLFGSRY